ncbi:hypothetical protein BDV98DRAFT_570686 [Pterulicium gracile]|uniref:Methyltransferase domain-containing protein n=1 Tax=Pterulicium gracile TaxID=1884261 RepID=A0A5C3QCA1_9AGAR|nr:hypothetical protein BDV98DRAFT_570686 [Pterula gracilis]
MSFLVDPSRPTNGQSGRSGGRSGKFTSKHGHRHHLYDSEKAPYPVSFDKHVLELEALNIALVKNTHSSMSFIDFSEWEEGAPSRSLDLGCGTGVWVLEAAREWPECDFVGFDLVDVQLPLRLVDQKIAERISWMHGNFLTNKLPFEDDEFDHIHMSNIALGVPENKWGMLFEEVTRVLRPGGAVEVWEDDGIFPQLPKWFTSPLRARTRRSPSVQLPEAVRQAPTPTPRQGDEEHDHNDNHDHALLESLYHSVFRNRFINTKPTAVLPSYFQTYFRQITLGPVITFPMPPLAAFQPLPQQALPNDISASLLDPRTSFSLSSALSSPGLSRNPSTSPRLPPSESIAGEWNLPTIFGESSSGRSRSPSSSDSSSSASHATWRRGSVVTLQADGRSMQPQQPGGAPMDRVIVDRTDLENNPAQMKFLGQLSNLSERSLAMHLYYSFQSVLACEEAMWEELKDRILNKKENLKALGWDDDEELEELQSRKKFERLLERYRTDMQSRVSLWVSLTGMGWSLPPRDPLTRAELIEEERLRENMLEARQFARPADIQPPCRVMRMLVGYKQETLI